MVIAGAVALAAMQVVSGGPIVGHAADVDPFVAIAARSSRTAAQRCAPLLVRKAGGTLNSIDVSRIARSGGRTTISGTMRLFLRPPPPAPGEMSPMHVINARFAYHCSLSGNRPMRATVKQLHG